MKVGIAMNMLHEPGRPDAAVVHEHFALGDLTEPLGFDSLWALEHHLHRLRHVASADPATGYFAGRTKRVNARHGGDRAAVARPNPASPSRSRCSTSCAAVAACSSFGRGAASVEYERFGIPMGEARPRFAEAAEVIVKALGNETFEHQGQFFKIPRTSIRPRPVSHPERRFYGEFSQPRIGAR